MSDIIISSEEPPKQLRSAHAPTIVLLLLFMFITTGLVFVFTNQKQSMNDIRNRAVDELYPDCGRGSDPNAPRCCSLDEIKGCDDVVCEGQNRLECHTKTSGWCTIEIGGCVPPPPPDDTATPMPTPVLSPATMVCQSYNVSTNTTPVKVIWTNGTGLQVWDSTSFWWWNKNASSPLIISSVNNAGVTPGIPPGRTVFARTTYNYVTFSTTTSVICPIPTSTPTPTITPTRTPTPTPTPPPSAAVMVCQSYNAATNTTPVNISWTYGTGLQVWDSTNFWWWNKNASSPLVISSVDNAGVIPGIPPGRTVYAKTTYNFTTFSTTTSVVCPTPTPTVTKTPTPTPTKTPTQTPTVTPTPIIAMCTNIKIYKNGAVIAPVTLKPGDTIVIAVTGGNATKARVRVNGKMLNGLVGWTESSTKNESSEYVFDFTIPLDISFVTIESEIYGLDGIWH